MANEKNTAVKGYKINFANNTITVNYTFKKASEEYGTAEYELLKNILADFPSPFQEFCMDDLKFSKNTDFEKLCNFYYYCLNDELFMAKPDEEKAMLLEDKGKHISRQTIAGYERKLFDVYFYSKSDTEFIYYFASDGNYRTAEHEEYLEAWHDYWEWKEQTKKELGNLRYVCARIKLKYGGFPRKQGIIQANAIEMPQIHKLIALTNESFEKAYSE